MSARAIIRRQTNKFPWNASILRDDIHVMLFYVIFVNAHFHKILLTHTSNHSPWCTASINT